MSTTSEFVRAVDFVGMPTRDLDAAVEFYGETLGMPRSMYIPSATTRRVRDRQPDPQRLSTPRRWGCSTTEPQPHRPPRRRRRERRGRARGSAACEFQGDVLDTGVCHMAFFADPDGNALMLHHRYAPRATDT